MDLESKSLALLGLAGSDDNRKSCPKLCTERMRHTLSQLILRACVGSVCVCGWVGGWVSFDISIQRQSTDKPRLITKL